MSERVQNISERRGLDGSTMRRERIVETDDAPAASSVREEPSARGMVGRVIWFIAGILLVLLAFRFALALLGANTSNAFANFIFNTSHPFVAPFFSLFS